MHATALGKAVLAYLAEAERKDVLDAGLPKLTGRTVSTLRLSSVSSTPYGNAATPSNARRRCSARWVSPHRSSDATRRHWRNRRRGSSERLNGRARENKVATVVGEAARSISRDLGAQRWPPT